jgi:uncharacterized GH25 family protein
VFGYGHGFPGVDALDPAEFQKRFNAPRLIGPAGELALTQGKDAMTYVSSEPLAQGTYLALIENKPGFGSGTPDGYRPGSKKDNPTALTCTLAHRYGKEVVAVGGPATGFDKPQGQALEIVPMIDPTRLKAREPFPVKILFNGKPLPGAEVTAYFAGFTPHNAANAFTAQADKDGAVEIIPLAPGEWLAKVSETADYPDAATCDRENWIASLTFSVTE